MTSCEVGMSNDKVAVQQVNIEELICALAEGKTEVMGELYENTSTAIFGYALSILKNRSDAEDVVHDCYLKVYQSCKNYSKQGKPLAWMLTITRNLCLEKIRKESKTLDIEVEEWMHVDIPELSNEEKLTIRESMLVLSEEERQIVYLHAVAGLKHREIAQVIGKGLGTVLSKYNRATKKLRLVLERGDS